MADIAEKPQDSRAIANYLIDIAPEYNIRDLSVMKLMKLMFLAHGWSFYFRNTPLLSEQPEAWQYGPVYRNVYWAFSGRGNIPINDDEKIENQETHLVYSANLTRDQKAVIDAVLKRYGSMTAFQLSNITHLENSPWDQTVKRDKGFFGVIPEIFMKNYYIQSAKERGMKAKAA